MYNFVLQTIVMVSLGTVIYLLARAVPRVSQTVSNEPIKRDYFEEFLKKLPLEKADAFANAWLEKFLRNLKVVVLKLDNILTRHLQKLKGDGSKEAERPTIFEKKEENEVK